MRPRRKEVEVPGPGSSLEHDGVFDGIIDLYGKNSCDLDEAWRRGVRAIIHRTSIGTDRDHEPEVYARRKAATRAKGFLWGAFHFLTMDDAARQLEIFLAVEHGRDPNTLMALDWEGKHHPPYAALLEVVQLFVAQTGFYPVLYAGNLVREQREIVSGDALLRRYPLWYSRYDTEYERDLHIPRATWPDYDLWQFCSEKRHFGKPFGREVLPGADFSRFKGTAAQLRERWPFRTVRT